MEVKIKVIAFEHPNSFKGGKYCCACRDICLFTANITFDAALTDIRKVLLSYLQDKKFIRLQKMGWKICGNSIIPPSYSDEELLRYAEEFYDLKISEYKITTVSEESNSL